MNANVTAFIRVFAGELTFSFGVFAASGKTFRVLWVNNNYQSNTNGVCKMGLKLYCILQDRIDNNAPLPLSNM